MPITSDASPFTSVTASPMEAPDADDLPIELKIPLPASSACSDEEGFGDRECSGSPQGPGNKTVAGEEDIHPKTGELGIDTCGEGEYDANIGETGSTGAPNVSLEELAHFVDLEQYHRHQTDFCQARRDQLSLSCGLDKRLIRTLTIAYGNMIDQYKTDDQAGFAGLYDACEQLTVSCGMAGRSIEHPPLGIGKNPTPLEDGECRPYIQRLSLDHQEAILAFLSQIRTEPFFLSDRISNMSSSELTALTSSYHPAGIDYSVLQNHSHGKTQIYSRDSQMMKLSRRMDNLHRFHNEDPFFAMLHGVFDASAKPGSRECLRRTDIWSTVCAQNFVKAFTETRPGSDELAIATLDAFANFHDWPLNPKVETFLMRTLSEGSFLIDAQNKQPVEFSESIEMHNAKAAIAEADFFENALTGLLDLLTKDRNEQAVPESALFFSHAVLRKIEDPKLRLRAKRYIVCSWYFATFISSILVYPEVRGIMMTHHIGDTARKSILQQLVLRLQQRVFDVILQWSGHALVKPEIRDGILTIFDTFEPTLQNKDDSLLLITDYDEDASARFLMLSPLDIIGLVQALYPYRLSPSNPQEPDPTVIGSDRPSTAGSSTLIAGSSEGGSVLAPSTAPSTAEASVISNKDLEDVSINGPFAQVLPSPEPSEAELKKESSRASEVTLKDLPSQLVMLCRRIKEILAQDKTPSLGFSNDSWSLIYYSRDGSAVSIGLKTHTRGRNAGRSSSRNRKQAGIHDSDGKYNVLKAAVVRLLSEEERSGMNALLVLAKATRDKRPHDPLETLIKAAMNKAQSDLDFGTSHEWWRILESYRALLKSNPNCSFFSVLQDVSQDLKTGIAAAAEDAEAYEVQCRSLDRMQQYNQRLLTGINQQRKALRVKMWYISDVRHSGTYEEALHVTRALRSMATSKRSKHPGSLTNWARQRLRGSAFHERAEAQTLEAITAPKDHGSLSKLADEQVEITSRWMTRKSIENFCRGEERIHRFCHEVQRSVGKIAGASLLDNPVLWSSNLFKRERYSFDTQRLSSSALGPPYRNTIAQSSPFGFAPSYSPILASQGAPPMGLSFSGSRGRSPTNNTGGFWSAAQASRPSTGPPSYGMQPPLPPTPTSPPRTWSSNSFSPTSPLHAFAPPFPFNPRFGGHRSHLSDESEPTPAKNVFAEEVKRSLCSLLISDLGYLLWNNGSETDVWTKEYAADGKNESKGKQVTSEVIGPLESILNPPATAQSTTYSGNMGHQLENKNGCVPIPSLLPGPSSQVISAVPMARSFPFSEAYATLLQNMSLTPDPWKKLQLLYELEDLILRSIQSQESTRSDPLPWRPVNISLQSRSVPRTKATSLEEVIANCTERRAGTIRAKGLNSGHSLLDFVQDAVSVDAVGTDDMVNTLLSLFRDPKLRPKALFRDLQYIAAFIPSETLDQTPQGKAFWDAGLAALALKEDLCESIINRANEITAYHISATKPLNFSVDNPLASTNLRDAAKLWLITAKEGSPVAARELGLFYLTHPELIPRVTMPFSKAKDVFKSMMANDFRSGDKEKGALDPVTFAVVFHWMEIAANGGDKDASDFLRGNGELSGGR